MHETAQSYSESRLSSSRAGRRRPGSLWPRVQLFEFNDQPWLPEPIRVGLTSYLKTILGLVSVFSPLVPRIGRLVAQQNVPRIIDLGSGTGGPYPRLAREIEAELNRPLPVVLTDLFPDAEGYARIAKETGGRVSGLTQPIDATKTPANLRGLRTVFDACHHLTPSQARALLVDAVRAGDPILVAEGNTRSLTNLVGMFLVPIWMWLLTPWVRPVRISQLVLTYLIPVLPLVATFDGVVSVLRTYRADELLALAQSVESDYVWEAGTFRQGGRDLPYLLGQPPDVA